MGRLGQRTPAKRDQYDVKKGYGYLGLAPIRSVLELVRSGSQVVSHCCQEIPRVMYVSRYFVVRARSAPQSCSNRAVEPWSGVKWIAAAANGRGLRPPHHPCHLRAYTVRRKANGCDHVVALFIYFYVRRAYVGAVYLSSHDILIHESFFVICCGMEFGPGGIRGLCHDDIGGAVRHSFGRSGAGPLDEPRSQKKVRGKPPRSR